MNLSSPVTDIKGVGQEVARKLAVLGIGTVGELIDYLPRRYDDYSDVQPLNRIKPGPVTIKARISQVVGRYVRRGMHVTEAIASDDTGSVRLVWFNQPYRETSFKKGAEYYISGDFGLNRARLSIINPSVELVSDFPVNTARILPLYKETKGLKSARIRRYVKEVLPLVRNLPETLPDWLSRQRNLLPRAKAYEIMHFPPDARLLAHAKRRLAFEEVFQLSLASLLNKYELVDEKAVAIKFSEPLARRFVSGLPFKLTDDQRRAVWRIYQDMNKRQPMSRMLEGDVGSGKTVVAAMAALMVMYAGRQVALMAPTELLARQHADTLLKLLAPLGMADKVGLLVGGLKPKAKQLVRDNIGSGQIGLVVGTHALIQEKVDFSRLALVIIDEQHRFGVNERQKLQAKARHAVHVLTMTATPIPRSLALTLYGELDITIIADKPPGRRPVKTKIVSPNSKKQLYESVDRELAAGRQMFVVAPLISESEAVPAASVEKLYAEIAGRHFKHRRVGLLHGKMKPADKEAAMRRFIDRDLDILVSTTVIEVGVDVPNATVMIIENADRFGLAQIHQLRGRVGRSQQQGYCYLVLSDSRAPSRRLKALESTSDGFKLAEMDLEIRGPGAIYGRQQHGALDLKIASLNDVKLIASARQAAQQFIDRGEDLLRYKLLRQKVSRLRTVTNLN